MRIRGYSHSIVQEDLLRMRQASLPWSQFDGKTVLVTGATGMLASYVCWLLLSLREQAGVRVSVIALCRDAGRASELFGQFVGKPYFRLLIQDVCEPIEVEGPVDYVFHLAGNASPHFINTDPVGILRANLQGTLSVLELAREKSVAGVVFASSREVYGRNDSAPALDEQAFGVLDPLDDRSCYPEGKRAAEALFRSYYLQFGIPYYILRIAHAYGPTMRLEGDGRVMADLLADAVAGRDIVLKSTGEAIRAFLYVTDAVLGMFTALLLGSPASVYNLANETEPISIRSLAQLLAVRRGLRVIVPANPGEVCLSGESGQIDRIVFVPSESDDAVRKGYCAYPRTALDTSALESLGWEPLVGLEEGVGRVMEYYGSL